MPPDSIAEHTACVHAPPPAAAVPQATWGELAHEMRAPAPQAAWLGQRHNAVKHGCTAVTLVESITGMDRVAALTTVLTATYNPANAVEALLVQQLAYHLAAMDLSTVAEQSAFRTVINQTEILQSLLQSAAFSGSDGCTCQSTEEPCLTCRDRTDTAITAAVASDPIARIGKYGVRNTRRISELLKFLEQIQARQRCTAPPSAEIHEPIDEHTTSLDQVSWLPAETEEECLDLFCRWRHRQRIPCPRCSTLTAPRLITGRQALRCTKCRHQYGLRYGTLLAASRLSFLAWIRAIRLLAQNPLASLSTVANTSGGITKSVARRVKAVTLQALSNPAQREHVLAMAGLRISRQKAASPKKPR